MAKNAGNLTQEERDQKNSRNDQLTIRHKENQPDPNTETPTKTPIDQTDREAETLDIHRRNRDMNLPTYTPVMNLPTTDDTKTQPIKETRET